MEKENDIREFLRKASSLTSFSTEDLEADSAVMVLKNPSEMDINGFRELHSRASTYGFDRETLKSWKAICGMVSEQFPLL